MIKKLLVVFFLLCFGNTLGAAQSVNGKVAPSGLALEVTFSKGTPPAYMAVEKFAAPGKGSWFAAFGHIAGFKNSADVPPVRAVKFVYNLENETVKFNVSVLTGKLLDNEIAVASYSAREKELITVKELAAFGVVPFELKVTRVASSMPVLPSFENKTVSLQIVGLEPQSATLPGNKLSLLNNSGKTVSAVTFEVTVDGETVQSIIKLSDKDRALIEPGKTFEQLLPASLERRKISDGNAPSVESNQAIIVTSVMFADGSFEGDRYMAARLRAYELGRKMYLNQIVSLIEANELKNQSSDSNNFAEQALSLKLKVDEKQLNELLSEFPDLSDKEKLSVGLCAEVDLSKIKRDFLYELETRLQKSAPIDEWLGSTKTDYQNWLTRLY